MVGLTTVVLKKKVNPAGERCLPGWLHGENSRGHGQGGDASEDQGQLHDVIGVEVG